MDDLLAELFVQLLFSFAAPVLEFIGRVVLWLVVGGARLVWMLAREGAHNWL